MSSPHMMLCQVSACLFALSSPLFADDVVDHPLSRTEREAIVVELGRQLESLPAPEEDADDAVQRHSRRGDVLFYQGNYNQAVAEYCAMVRADPELDASHWRLGIALFFADQPEAAAAQFDRYHSFDDVDRENGIWRFLSHYRAFGAERAAQQLLKYSKDDREPFPAVYGLFDGSISPPDALAKIPNDLAAAERDKRLFYTELYIGMLERVRGHKHTAQVALRDAVSRKWPRTAGFGPHFMWHVARLQFEELADATD
jgi:lipoprotein NlpI